MPGAATQNIQRVLAVLCDIVDKDGMVPHSPAVVQVGRRTGLQELTVRKHLKALMALRVIEVVRAREKFPVANEKPRLRNFIRLLKPDAVIVKRGGFYTLD